MLFMEKEFHQRFDLHTTFQEFISSEPNENKLQALSKR